MVTEKIVDKKLEESINEINKLFDILEEKGVQFLSYTVIGMDCKIDGKDMTKINAGHCSTISKNTCTFRTGNTLTKKFFSGSRNIVSHFSIDTDFDRYQPPEEPTPRGVH